MPEIDIWVVYMCLVLFVLQIQAYWYRYSHTYVNKFSRVYMSEGELLGHRVNLSSLLENSAYFGFQSKRTELHSSLAE